MTRFSPSLDPAPRRTPRRGRPSAAVTLLLMATLGAGSPAASSPSEPTPSPVSPRLAALEDVSVTTLEAQTWSVPVTFSSGPAAPVPIIQSSDLSPQDSVAVWRQLFELTRGSGWSPVVVPADGPHSIYTGDGAVPFPVEQWVSEATAGDPGAVFTERETERRQQRAETLRMLGTGLPAGLRRDYVSDCAADPASCLPTLEDERAELAATPDALLAGHADGAFPPRLGYVDLAEAMGRAGYDVDQRFHVLVLECAPPLIPLYLGFGGWNDCPTPVQHVRVLTHWLTAYGAHLVFLGDDTLELWVESPPQTPQAIREVAWQQYLYCEDIVYQGAGTFSALAEALARTSDWGFWWD